MATTKITDDSFEADVLKSGTPVLVDFWAEWCGPCKQIGPALEEIASEMGGRVTVAKLNIDENPMVPGRYGVRGIPTLNAFTGSHEDYHLPSDTADKLDYDKAAQITRLIGLIARSVATAETNPDFVAMEAPKSQGTRGGLRAYLGTIPDYAQGDIKGVKLSGVSPIGPAGKAGVKGGDIIIKLAGKEVLNIYDYTEAMADLKVGEETTITVKRGEEEMTLKLVPASRD